MQKMVPRLIEENQSFQENITQLEEELDQVDIALSSSDGASTQKHLNKLVEEHEVQDRALMGILQLTLCTISVACTWPGVNLHKAQNAGVRRLYNEATEETKSSFQEFMSSAKSLERQNTDMRYYISGSLRPDSSSSKDSPLY